LVHIRTPDHHCESSLVIGDDPLVTGGDDLSEPLRAAEGAVDRFFQLGGTELGLVATPAQ